MRCGVRICGRWQIAGRCDVRAYVRAGVCALSGSMEKCGGMGMGDDGEGEGGGSRWCRTNLRVFGGCV